MGKTLPAFSSNVVEDARGPPPKKMVLSINPKIGRKPSKLGHTTACLQDVIFFVVVGAAYSLGGDRPGWLWVSGMGGAWSMAYPRFWVRPNLSTLRGSYMQHTRQL